MSKKFEDYEMYKKLLSLEIPLNMLVGEVKFYQKKVSYSVKKKEKLPPQIKQEARQILNSIEYAIDTLGQIKNDISSLFNIKKSGSENVKKNTTDLS